MKPTITVLLTLIIFGIAGGCEDLDNDSGENNKTVMNPSVFVLCEGEFGAPNASLWSIDITTREHSGPLYWTTDNPLGDTGQSLKFYDGKLYVVLNNSHSVEVLNFESEEPVHDGTLDVPGASPRYLEIIDGTGFLTSWGLGGILVFDTETLTITDTLSLPGWPEKVLHTPWGLFVTVPMKSYTEYTDRIYQYDPDNLAGPVDSFSVVPGPIDILVFENSLFVASTYYDSYYNTYGGISKIDPVAGSVETNNFGQIYGLQKNLLSIDGTAYRLTGSGPAPIREDLSLDFEAIPVSLKGAYAAQYLDSKLYVGTTDYSAPDSVFVFTGEMLVDTVYQVKALPTDFEFVDPESEM